MSRQQVPGPAQQNNERVTARSYEKGFASFPDEEVVPVDDPGGGPSGTLDDGRRNAPLVVVAVGFVVAFLSLGYASLVPLGVGALLVLAGAVWAGLSHQAVGSGHGTGPAAIDQDAAEH